MGDPNEQKPAPARWAPYVAMALLAAVLVAPAAFRSPMQHDSFWIDWVWADQFTALLRQGEIYPRWLPRSHDGLGSPVFYYYPPLAFYLIGLFGLAGLSTWSSILAAFGLSFALSGFAMYHWLKDWAPAPLAGALFYMAAPYHVLDFVSRGNPAESLSFVFIPLVALGLRRISDGRGPWLTALAYAALIMTHLPMALLVSLFLIGPLCLRLSRGRPLALLPFVVPILVGAALAGLYLVPALALGRFRDAAQLWALPDFHPERWSLLQWDAVGPDPGMRALIAFTLGGLLLTSLLLFLRRRSGWIVWTWVILVFAAGLIPGFWRLPVVEQVQFPFRLLPIAEFALATAVAATPLAWPWLVVRLLPALILSAGLISATPPRPAERIEDSLARYPDVPENLPPGERPYSWPSRWAVDLARQHPAPVRRGDVTIEPVFYFPSWRVECGGRVVPTFPAESTSLLAYRGTGCIRRLSLTPAERIGIGVSLAGWLVLLGLWLGARIRSARSTSRAAPSTERK